ncbi:2OG-Fe(II) oxygenase [Myxococcota bacterium]|nr:2OG-Fe(II) oxygenase [Myxococcota bacterium]MCZ7618308.1 2OG-Fe(II) oxygenase [Myxococcota bacterium]
MGRIDLDALDATELTRDPFDFVVVPDFLAPGTRGEIQRDFPKLLEPGNVALADTRPGPAFLALVEELRGPEMTRRIAAKFGVDLEHASTHLTLRGRVQRSDGSIHTDSWTKLITVLLYFNDAWTCAGGRLRLLRSPTDIEDYAAEVAPVSGTLLAFRRSNCSYHGHKPIEGERRVLQMSWVRPSRLARMTRHVKRATTRARQRLHLDRESNVADS